LKTKISLKIINSIDSKKRENLKISTILIISFTLMLIFKENFFIVEILLLLFSFSILWIVCKKYSEIRI